MILSRASLGQVSCAQALEELLGGLWARPEWTRCKHAHRSGNIPPEVPPDPNF